MNYEILSIIFTRSLTDKKICNIINLNEVSHLFKSTFDEIYTSNIVLKFRSAKLLSTFIIDIGLLDVFTYKNDLDKNDYCTIIKEISIAPFLEKSFNDSWSRAKHILEDPFYPYIWKNDKTKTNFKILQKHRKIFKDTNINAILNHASKPNLSYKSIFYFEI